MNQPDLFADRSPVPTAAEADRAQRDGMAAAVEHADDVVFAWSQRAEALLVEFAGGVETFLAEDARAFAAERGLPSPPDGRAWGAVLQRARRANLIQKVGFAPARSSNNSPKVEWAKAAAPSRQHEEQTR